MTAELDIETESTDGSSVVKIIKFHPTNNAIENEIFEFLAKNPNILFKSQQIDDPEISIDEKMCIASDILLESHLFFLQRFGKYLTMKYLNYFQNALNPDDYEVQYLIKDLRINLEKRKKNIKNRRFTALKEMIKKNEYFNETEMMKREPYLYEQFIGQYLTDSEKKIRDGYDPTNTPFSKVLLDGIDRDRIEELRKKQAKYDIDVTDESTQQSDISKAVNNSEEDEYQNFEELYPKIPPSFRKHWGNFEDESNSVNQTDQPSTSTSCRIPPKRKNNEQKYITASEREMLRQEFVEIMHSKFLEGQDKDFDYSAVDDNTELDDFEQINQDKEDEYFNEDEDDGDNCIRNDEGSLDDDEEDDLDIFMKHLNEHPTLKRSFK